MEHESDGDTSCSWSTKEGTQSHGKKTGGTGDQKRNRDYPDHIIVKNT